LTIKSNFVDWSKTKRKLEHIQEVTFTFLPTQAKIDILIGANCHDLMQSFENIFGKKSDHPWAVKMLLGWS